MDEPYVIAIDIGGTSFRVALASVDGQIIARNSELTHATEGPERGIQRIIDTIRKTASGIGMGRVKGITVAAAGPIDPKEGIFLTPPSLPTWHNVPLKSKLKNEFQIPIWVENDADMAAVGEHRFGAGKGSDRLIYITVSTGIGGGVIIDDQPLHGVKISAAELGHIVIDPDGPQCNCGGKGHVEAMASGTAIARMACERISRDNTSALSELCGNDLSRLTAKMVTEAASSGDSVAIEVINEAGANLGIAVASLIHIFDPDVVIIGGGVSNAGELILKPVRESVAVHAMADFRDRTKIVRSELGDDSGIYGAIAFALDQLKSS
ncbi:ROK family protein [Chloroflexota bacterium]